MFLFLFNQNCRCDSTAYNTFSIHSFLSSRIKQFVFVVCVCVHTYICVCVCVSVHPLTDYSKGAAMTPALRWLLLYLTHDQSAICKSMHARLCVWTQTHELKMCVYIPMACAQAQSHKHTSSHTFPFPTLFYLQLSILCVTLRLPIVPPADSWSGGQAPRGGCKRGGEECI